MRNQVQNKDRVLAKKLTNIALLLLSEEPAKSDPLDEAISLDSELLDQPYDEHIIHDNDSFETINLKLWHQC